MSNAIDINFGYNSRSEHTEAKPLWKEIERISLNKVLPSYIY